MKCDIRARLVPIVNCVSIVVCRIRIGRGCAAKCVLVAVDSQIVSLCESLVYRMEEGPVVLISQKLSFYISCVFHNEREGEGIRLKIS